MQFAELIEFTALAVGHSGHVIQDKRRIPDSALHAFWLHHRDLANCWSRELSDIRSQMTQHGLSDSILAWRNAQPLFREILQTAVLVRSWTAVLTAAGSYEATSRSEAIARNVLTTYLEVRKVSFELLLAGADFDPAATGRFNLFRGQVDRWIDLLVGRLLPQYHVEDFAIDSHRATEMGQQHLQKYLDSGLVSLTNPLWLQLKVMTGESGTQRQRSYSQLLQSVLAMFPHSAFNAQGMLRPAELTAMQARCN